MENHIVDNNITYYENERESVVILKMVDGYFTIIPLPVNKLMKKLLILMNI